MKKLYSVHVSFEILVMAENDSEALDLAQSNANLEVSNVSDSFETIQIHSENEIEDKEWLSSIPYGSDDEKTVAEIIREING